MICNTCESLAESVCDLEQPFFGAEVAQALQHVDRIAEILKGRGVEQASLRRQVEQLNRALFHEQELRFTIADPCRAFALTGTLLDGCGNCLGLTTAYLAVASRLRVPVRAVLYEGHIAACVAVDGQFQPIEVSRRGLIPQGRLASLMYSRKGAAQVLTDMQFLAVHKANQAAFIYGPVGDYDTSRALLESAISDFPNYVGAWINLAALAIAANEPEKAAESLDSALRLGPSGDYLRHALAMLGHLRQGRRPALLHIV